MNLDHTWIEALGYSASLAVFATFCMTTMIPLRLIALVSNVLFISYGALAPVYPLLILHMALLPINLLRLRQIFKLVNGVKAASSSEVAIEKLVPFMTSRTYKAGDTVIRKGDAADRMFYVTRGEVRVVEISKSLGPGSLIGEIGVFARDQKRTATVQCVTDCELLELTQAKAKEIYFQNPAFGYAILQIIVARLEENMEATRQPSAPTPASL